MSAPNAHAADPDALDNFVRALPKAEMHIHLEGAYRWSSIRELHTEALPEREPWLENGGGFADFNDFRDVFLNFVRPTSQTAKRVERHTYEVISDLAARNVRYAELICGVGFHVLEGLTPAEVLDAMAAGRDRARRETGIDARFVLGMNRHQPLDDALNMLDAVAAHEAETGSRVIEGVDLQGDERLARARAFLPAVERARDAGLRIRAHAGELDGPRSVWEAIDVLGATHISHGVRAAEDPTLVRALAERGTYLHVCPTSNLRLGLYATADEHPLRDLLDAGCRVTLNSDDPLLFGTSITDEFRAAATDFRLSASDLLDIARTAIESTSGTAEQRSAWLGEVDQTADAHREIF